MEHLHHDLGWLSAGDVVQVHLANAANVRLLDDGNYRSYQRGGAHRAVGGYAKESPVRFAVPSAGHWHVAVDLGGASGRVGASVSLLKAA